jgi:hypothetical protein
VFEECSDHAQECDYRKYTTAGFRRPTPTPESHPCAETSIKCSIRFSRQPAMLHTIRRRFAGFATTVRDVMAATYVVFLKKRGSGGMLHDFNKRMNGRRIETTSVLLLPYSTT